MSVNALKKVALGFLKFAYSILSIVFFWVWIFAKIDQLIEYIQEQWKYRGVDKEALELKAVEAHYKKYGTQCTNCKCYIPKTDTICPVCNNILPENTLEYNIDELEYLPTEYPNE